MYWDFWSLFFAFIRFSRFLLDGGEVVGVALKYVGIVEYRFLGGLFSFLLFRVDFNSNFLGIGFFNIEGDK